jgi:peptide-methionine (S)-S-oxide reductase
MRLDRRNGIIMRRTMTGLLLVLCAVATAWGQGSVPQGPTQAPTEKRATATFAGGCFWCVEADFDKVEGVLSTTSGYTAGHLANPTYSQVSAGGTGHTEAVQIVYDPAKVTYQKLLDVFWRNHDPLTKNRQFCDGGDQYRAGIFYHDAEQKRLAEASKVAAQGRLKQPVVTEITAAATFYPAEDYHQDYYLKNPVRYKFYRFNCGRDKRLEEIWGKAGITSR